MRGKAQILLVNPLVGTRAWHTTIPNLGLGYLSASLKREGFHVSVLDAAQKEINPGRYWQTLLGQRYDVVGFQVFSCALSTAAQQAALIKARFPETKVIAGGAHPSAAPEEILRCFPEIDCCFQGECELALVEFMGHLAGEKPLDQVPNVFYRSNGKILRGQRSLPENLDELLPDWDAIAPYRYPRAPVGTFVKAFPTAPMMATRGCPLPCTFCATSTVGGKRIRTRSPESVVSEMAYLQHRYGVREVQFLDDNFTWIREYAAEVCETLLRRGLNMNLSFPNGVRLDALDPELLKLMERAGCYSMTVGIDSGSNRVLKAMRRGLTTEQIAEILWTIKKTTKIRITGNFILGHPEETLEDIKKTIAFACSLPLDRAQFASYIPLPGTSDYLRLARLGRLPAINYDDLVFERFHLPIQDADEETLFRLKQRAYRKFYLRLPVLLGLMKEVHSFDHLLFISNKFYEVVLKGVPATNNGHLRYGQSLIQT